MNSDDLDNIDDLAFLDDPIGLNPRTWYRFVQLEMNLLRAYVQGVEKNIDDSVKAYYKEKVATDISDDDQDGYGLTVIFEEHRGIEGPPSHLEDIFEYYFPNLQRRSALIVLFSFFEHQLDQLSELFASRQNLNIRHIDLNGRGIDRSRLYLKKVIGLDLGDNSSSWQEIKKVQKIRNVIVHNDAKLIDKDVIRFVNESAYLSTTNESNYYREVDEVNILKDYLTYVLDTFDSYCNELNKAIGIRFGTD